MPTAPPRLCVRCRRGTVTGTVCTVCGERPVVKRSQQDRRGSAASRGYDRRWQKARKAALLADPWCAECMAAGRYVTATVGHHEQEIDGRYDPGRLDGDNIVPLCRECHERLHGRVK